MIVIATRQIVEDDLAPDPAAEPCAPGFVHCDPGQLGEVIHVGEGNAPTVRFFGGGCTLCVEGELVAVAWLPAAAD